MQETRGVGSQPRPTEDTPQGKSWFLGIGINQYQHFPNLNNAVKDIEDIQRVLEERYCLEPKYTLILKNEEANRDKILSTFDHLLEIVSPEDKLLIYYSGHGELLDTGENKRGYWIPTDAEKDKTTQYIRNSTIRDYIQDIKALHTLLISDSCYSGTLFMDGVTRSEAAMEELEKRKSRWAICSGRSNEEVHDGQPGTNSPFANGILDILVTNQLPKLNVAKLADRVMELTRANYEQMPEGNPLFGIGHNGGQYIFTLKDQLVIEETPAEKEEEVIEKTKENIEQEKSIPIPPSVEQIFPKGFKQLDENTGIFKDQRDGHDYRIVKLEDGLWWFATNLRFESKNSWRYKGNTDNYLKNGRLYTWQAARHAACPRGWCLPTYEEWKNLAMVYGGFFDRDEGKLEDPQAAYQRLWASPFEPQLGGRRDSNGDFRADETIGTFWTGTSIDEGVAWSFDFQQEDATLYSRTNLINSARSVRYIMQV